jgi:putative ABC transport system permease protein
VTYAPPVLFVSVRDLQYRRRRFLIGVFATGLVFALAVVITGINQSFVNEVTRTVDAIDVDQWIVSEKASGPFTSSTLIEAATVTAIARQPGVTDASPVAILRFTIPGSPQKDIGVIGVEPGSIATAPVADGRELQRDGEVVVDRSLGYDVGEKVSIGGRDFTVVGRTKGVSYYAGQPATFMTLKDAQNLTFAGAPLATAIVTKGTVTDPPKGTIALTNDEVITDLQRPMKQASGTILMLCILLWIVAAGIIGSILYVQAIERTGDFAVFKATGVTGGKIATGLAFEAIVLALLSAVVAIVLAQILGPLMPMSVETPGSAYLLLVAVAVVIGILASLFGLRRAVSVDPALAFG